MSKRPNLKVVPLSRHRTPAQQDAEALLADWWREAQAGGIAGVAIAVVTPDGRVKHQMSSTDNWPALMGAIAGLFGEASRR